MWVSVDISPSCSSQNKTGFNPTQRGVSAEDRSVSERVPMNTPRHVQGSIRHVPGSQVHLKETLRPKDVWRPSDLEKITPTRSLYSENLRLRPNRKESPRIEQASAQPASFPSRSLPLKASTLRQAFSVYQTITNKQLEVLHVSTKTETLCPCESFNASESLSRLFSCFLCFLNLFFFASNSKYAVLHVYQLIWSMQVFDLKKKKDM